MADRRKRSLERAAAQTGDEDSEARAILAGLRTGEVSGPLVELHAELGDPVARLVCGRPDRRPPDEDRVRELCSDPAYGLAFEDPTCGRMVFVPGGVSLMGSAEDDPDSWSDECPQMLVCVPPFWIAQRPLTLSQWWEGGGTGGSSVSGGNAVVNVSWNDVQAWLGRQETDGASYRVRRGGGCYNHARFCRADLRNGNSPGVRFGALGFRPARSVEGNAEDGHVFRGGSWSVPARYCRADLRNGNSPGVRRIDLGFRPARSVEGNAEDGRVLRGGGWSGTAGISRADLRGRDSPGYRGGLLGFRPAVDAAGPLRLPTEDEWERAARGWDGRVYPWGGEWVGSREERRRRPSPWGVYDMSGEVWQWCADAWSESRHGEVANG